MNRDTDETFIENTHYKYDLNSASGLIAVIGPAYSGKSSLITDATLVFTHNDDLGVIENGINEKLNEITHQTNFLYKIVFDEVDPGFYKTGIFKDLCSFSKKGHLQVVIIVQTISVLPTFVKNKINHWLLYNKLNASEYIFTPLDQIKERFKAKNFTFIVVSFHEGGYSTHWYNKHEMQTVVATKTPNNIMNSLMVIKQKLDKISLELENLVTGTC